jgi:hypothetical protein
MECPQKGSGRQAATAPDALKLVSEIHVGYAPILAIADRAPAHDSLPPTAAPEPQPLPETDTPPQTIVPDEAVVKPPSLQNQKTDYVVAVACFMWRAMCGGC